MNVLFREIPYDQTTPIAAYRSLGAQSMIESRRYSFVAIDPIDSISGKDDYIKALRQMRARHPVTAAHRLALYAGSPIGHITYDNEYCFQIFRSAVAFDHETGQAVLSTLGDEAELDCLFHKLHQPIVLSEEAFKLGEIELSQSDESFIEMVKRAKKHLEAGDIYQIVLSREFQRKFEGDPFEFYCALRKKSPAPFHYFFDLGEGAIVGASPEKIISVQGGIIESMPIAGTRPKGASLDDLLNDPKEIAEHVMLVDLARNDVGAVSVPGSVKVLEFKTAQEFSHVTHIVSRVSGRLDPKYDALDAFKASFPAGTLTGAPKRRAMELIDEIETKKRGLYGGAIVALDSVGNLTSCIAIRTAVLRGGQLIVRAGAGIVLDSEPMKEAEETRLKARSILCF